MDNAAMDKKSAKIRVAALALLVSALVSGCSSSFSGRSRPQVLLSLPPELIGIISGADNSRSAVSAGTALAIKAEVSGDGVDSGDSTQNFTREIRECDGILSVDPVGISVPADTEVVIKISLYINVGEGERLVAEGSSGPVSVPSAGSPSEITVIVKLAVTGIKAEAAEDGLTFRYGAAFDPSRVTVTAEYADGSSESIDSGLVNFSGYDGSRSGPQTVTAEYRGFTAAITVTVDEPEAEISAAVEFISSADDVDSGSERNGKVYEFTAAGGFDSYSWSCAAITGSERKFTVDTSGFVSGNYLVRLSAEKSGKIYFWQYEFEVSE